MNHGSSRVEVFQVERFMSRSLLDGETLTNWAIQ
ncbi:hypothetical protein XELAEV_180042722mg, partial [Xenopus laevis]